MVVEQATDWNGNR